LHPARDELLRNRLILQTRHGGLRNGSNFYALTWLAISNYVGLDIGPSQYYPGLYLLPPPPVPEKTADCRTVLEAPL
jgi:hypothetical protein